MCGLGTSGHGERKVGGDEDGTGWRQPAAVDPATRGNRPTMTTSMSLSNAARLRFAATLGLLALGLATLPAGWTRARAAIDSARSPELNRVEREASAGGLVSGVGMGTRVEPSASCSSQSPFFSCWQSAVLGGAIYRPSGAPSDE